MKWLASFFEWNLLRETTRCRSEYRPSSQFGSRQTTTGNIRSSVSCEDGNAERNENIACQNMVRASDYVAQSPERNFGRNRRYSFLPRNAGDRGSMKEGQKVFIALEYGVSRCLICEEWFSREGSRLHSDADCHPMRLSPFQLTNSASPLSEGSRLRNCR
jgi:hypothetical protein